MNRLLTTDEVAQILNFKDRKTVRKLVKAKKLRRVIVGERSVRFHEEDVQEYLRGLTCHSPNEVASGTTSSRSQEPVIAGPHGRRKKPRPGLSSSENVTALPWVKKKEPSL